MWSDRRYRLPSETKTLAPKQYPRVYSLTAVLIHDLRGDAPADKYCLS